MKQTAEKSLKNRALKKIAGLIAITMLAAIGLFYLFFRSIVLEKEVETAEENLGNMAAYLETYIDEVDSIARDVNYDYYLQNYLASAIAQEEEYLEPSSIKNMREYEMSSRAFSDTLLSRSDISSIMVFGKKNLLFQKSMYSYRSIIMDYTGLDWYAKAVENPQQPVITGPNQHVFFDTNDKMISLSREIQSYENGSFLGVILINLNLNKIAEICESFQANEQSFLCVLNREGELVYEQQSGKERLNLEKEENDGELQKLFAEAGQGKLRIRLEGEDYLATVHEMDKADWFLYSLTPYTVITDTLLKTSMMIIAAVAMTLVLTLAMLNRILKGIIRPLEMLQSHMDRVTIENLNEQVPIESDDEIGKLSGNFNNMLERIEHLKEQVVAEQEEKRRYELQALQAQINPHFLYNTLDSIIWMAETRDKNIVAMTEALAKLFRISLNKGNEEILLKRELEHVRNYLIIQSMRYAEKFTFDIQAEPEVENCRIIKLILQPIVENCIYHGIKKKKGAGHISIAAYEERGLLKIQVTDDGCGMSSEMCQKMLSDEIEPENISGSGIGVKNVNDRIRLRFGKEYGLHYTSEEGKGTTVEYTLPILREDSYEK